MNTDHINYQQQIAQAVNEEKAHELLDKSDSAPKQQISSCSPSTSTEKNQNEISTNQHINTRSENNMNMLTPVEDRERICTLFIIALIALLTGTKAYLL